MRRTYGQYCGLARALDVVGDRWNLLIVRQLLIAPVRYRDLLEGLPGIATNLLADRLRDLEAAGVVERRLADDGNAVLYALTPWGTELRQPVESLIRWSTPLMKNGSGGEHFRSEWLQLALPALLGGRAAAGPPRTVGIQVGEELFQLQMSGSGVDIGAPDDRDLDGVLRADPAIVLGLAAGALTIDETRGLIEIEGDEAAVRAIFDSPRAEADGHSADDRPAPGARPLH